jgi:excisionase family DNA binding protein
LPVYGSVAQSPAAPAPLPSPRPKRPSELDLAASTAPASGPRLTVSQAALLLHVSPQLVRRWIGQGRLHASRVANQWLVQKKDLKLFSVRSSLGRPRNS